MDANTQILIRMQLEATQDFLLNLSFVFGVLRAWVVDFREVLVFLDRVNLKWK
jgi:hypothetical protein